MSEPLVTICIPTFNRPESLARVVEAVLSQSYPSIEVVITDDGDAERTRAALGPVLDRVRYHPNERRLGLYGNWNRAIGLARGEYIALFHDHDEYAPTAVARAVEVFQRSARVGMVHVGVEIVRPDGTRYSV